MQVKRGYFCSNELHLKRGNLYCLPKMQVKRSIFCLENDGGLGMFSKFKLEHGNDHFAGVPPLPSRACIADLVKFLFSAI